jgi:hypothetical protein
MIEIHQSTARRVLLKLFATGTTTAATGRTVAVTLSKNGAAFANPSAGATNASELGSGWYFVDLTATDTNTLGDLVVRGTASGCDDTERLFAVVAASNRGMTALPTANPAASGGIPTVDAGGRVAANTVQLAGQTVNATAAVTFPASVGTSTYAGADTSGVTTLLNRVPGAVALAGTAPTWYAAPPAGSTIAGEVWSASERKLSEFNFSVTLSAGQKIGLVDGSIGPASFGVPADSPGPANDPISWLRRIYQRSFNRRTRNRTTGVVTIFAGDNTTPVTTETQTTAGDLDTVTRAV